MAREPKLGIPGPRTGENAWRSDEYTFPSPAPEPQFRRPRSKPDRDRMISENDHWFTHDLIYKAVHTNDPQSRTFLARVADAMICNRHPMDKPHRDWLSWVLRRLVETDNVPHMARGNAIKTN